MGCEGEQLGDPTEHVGLGLWPGEGPGSVTGRTQPPQWLCRETVAVAVHPPRCPQAWAVPGVPSKPCAAREPTQEPWRPSTSLALWTLLGQTVGDRSSQAGHPLSSQWAQRLCTWPWAAGWSWAP